MQDTRCRMQDRASGRAEFKPVIPYPHFES
jgi:hypothetical protein